MEEARSREIKALLSQTKAALAQGDPRVALMNLTQAMRLSDGEAAVAAGLQRIASGLQSHPTHQHAQHQHVLLNPPLAHSSLSPQSSVVDDISSLFEQISLQASTAASTSLLQQQQQQPCTNSTACYPSIPHPGDPACAPFHPHSTPHSTPHPIPHFTPHSTPHPGSIPLQPSISDPAFLHQHQDYHYQSTAHTQAQALRSQQPILMETGRLGLTDHAIQSGACFVCARCQGVVPSSRREAHEELWCPRQHFQETQSTGMAVGCQQHRLLVDSSIQHHIMPGIEGGGPDAMLL